MSPWSYLVDHRGKNVFPEDIEALVFPSLEFFEERAQKEGGMADDEIVSRRIETIISEVNQQLLPYKRISRFTLLSEPMEMTTTRKIKRFKVAADRR